jgi:hypothetical protein
LPFFALDCLIIIAEIRISLRRSWSLAKADAIFQLSEGGIFHDRGPSANHNMTELLVARRQLIERS